MNCIDETQMPAPDTLVKCKNGDIAAMFFYAAAEQDLGDIAIEQGFKCRVTSLEHDDDELWEEYGAGGDVLAAWQPETPDGWTFGAKLDTEDGPIAIFVQRPPNAPQLTASTGENGDG